jgi:hypothetical protein
MKRKDIEKSWRLTTRHLNAARLELKQHNLHNYDEWLAHNELELAFDELENIGNGGPVSRKFWLEMLAAAESMKLQDHMARCRMKLKESP